MLYDSPTAGLDPITANTIVTLILKERDLRNTATIMVTHRYQDGHLMANFRYNPNSGQIERAGEQPVEHQIPGHERGTPGFRRLRSRTAGQHGFVRTKIRASGEFLRSMPLQTKKRWAQLKVGLMAIWRPALLAFLIFLMSSSTGLFSKRTDVYTFLDDSAAIASGAPVRLNGITVGKVANIGLSGSCDPSRIVKLTLRH